MNEKSCFFIGHRRIYENIQDKLIAIIEKHITEYGVTSFTVGHYGAFDILVQKELSKLKKTYPHIELNLLLPYHPIHDEIITLDGFVSIYPEGLENVPKRFAIVKANQNQINNSDYLVAYLKHTGSNTGNFIEYAQRREKKGLIKITLL